jgi:phage baseplate assembly protein W
MAINIKFPIEDDVEKNRALRLNNTTKSALTSDLLLLLLTEKGQRYYNPQYGTNLLQYVFEPKDAPTIQDIEEEIRDTVKTFIPQLTIKQIRFFEDVDDTGAAVGENQLSIVVDFNFSDDVFSEDSSITITV